MSEEVLAPHALSERDKLNQVNVGMEVFDRLGRRVGRVDDIYSGTGDELLTAPAPAPVMRALPAGSGQPVPGLTDAVGPKEGMPLAVRNRLLHDGFIRVDAGLLKHHRYVLPGQIDQVTGKRVTLRGVAEDLLKY